MAAGLRALRCVAWAVLRYGFRLCATGCALTGTAASAAAAGAALFLLATSVVVLIPCCLINF